MNNLTQKIEAVLFYKAEPVSSKKLAEILSASIEEINTSILELEGLLKERGVTLVKKEDEYMLGVSNEFSELIENLKKEELKKELSKSSLETLSIILYRNGATRSEIDFIRGVNSGFTLRALMVRDLIEKVNTKEDSRKYIYKPTMNLLAFMGVSKIEDLPNYTEINKNIENTLEDDTLTEN